jgi:myo-inositol-1(or 4)-monophosphatase
MDGPTVQDFLELASRLAREAGDISIARINDASASRKSDDTVVTTTDHAIQAQILGAVAELFPDHAVCAEEAQPPPLHRPPRAPPLQGGGQGSGGLHAEVSAARFCWVVDPLDGTRNYVSGLPCFATSIAVLERGRPVAAVVYEHNQRLLFSACAGGGAHLNGRRILVEDPPRHGDYLLGIPSSKDFLTQRVVRGWLGTKGFICRNLGATTVHLALVAAGSMAGAFGKQAKLWDVAAGALLVAEAGGRITDPFGGDLLPFRLDADGQRDIPFLAAGPVMHERLLESIRSATL